MKRVWLAPLLATGVLLSSAGPALADDLTDLLDTAAEADYAGRQIVVTFLDGQTAIEIVDVEHAGSMMMVGADGNEAVIGAGKLSAGEGQGLAVASWNSPEMSDRYAVGEELAVKRLGRAATAVEVFEADRRRMRLVFDDATGAPMVTEVFDGNGKLFRLSSMLEVDPIPHRIYSSPGHYSEEFEVLVPTSDHSMPRSAAAYELADAYPGPDDSVQGFFSDGLFSFSLFAFDGAVGSDRFAGATEMEIQGLTYQRMVSPGELWVTWKSAGDTYVLVGDLPPDHLEAVLDELPKPGRRNLFSRLWNGLFG